MKKLIEFWHTYPGYCVTVGWCIFVVIDKMPAPDKDSGVAYRWCYGAFNALAANLSRAFRTKLPSGLLNTEENAKAEGFVNKT